MPATSARKTAFTACRHRLELSQRQVCIDLDICDAHYRNIETGRANPDAKLLFKMANYFEVSPAELFPDLAEIRVPRSTNVRHTRTS